MKTKKWLTYSLGILLTLIVLTAVGAAGFRVGMMQSTSFSHPTFSRNFETMPQAMQENFQRGSSPHAMQGSFERQEWDSRSNDRRDGGINFFSPIFGLIRLAVLGLLLWLGYKYIKNSGWRLTRAQAVAAPITPASPSTEVENAKEVKEENTAE
jgi:hypothetical protein